MINKTKTGFVTFMGAPNVGKSTLVNTLVGEKISIVTHKAQTTRSSLRGILMYEKSQIILIDTPGIFSPNRKLDRAMVGSAWNSSNEADVVCFVYDAARKSTDNNTIKILEGLSKFKTKLCLIMNKIDLIDTKKLLPLIESLSQKYNFNNVFMISALKNNGIRDLKLWLSNQMPVGPYLYNPDEISDIPARLMVSEILREKLILNLHQELPYNLIVDSEGWETKQDKSIKISQIIYVSKPSHKAMVIGKSGKNIKLIGMLARKEIQILLNTKIHLFLRVKIKEKCLEDANLLKKWGLEVSA